VLLQRIEAAAEAVCSRRAQALTLPKDYQACRGDAVENAVRTLGVETLKAVLAESQVDYLAK
jgi:UrcA family protein